MYQPTVFPSRRINKPLKLDYSNCLWNLVRDFPLHLRRCECSRRLMNDLALPSFPHRCHSTFLVHLFTQDILTSGHCCKTLWGSICTVNCTALYRILEWPSFNSWKTVFFLLHNICLCFSFCLECCSFTLLFFTWLISLHLDVWADSLLILPHQGQMNYFHLSTLPTYTIWFFFIYCLLYSLLLPHRTSKNV